ncbi:MULTISPECIES: D-alanine--D-alanine ligase family protein [Acutalibacteraceae]|uniref:D-alanine--D-alanine ligase family protein n=1 Tax=Acutalibacteraceae TaxID=3082771 RepID=UPI001FAAE16D|nr:MULTISPECIES: ATP-grasp domain-containing protein [Acutalibacteraceae]
MEAEFDSLETIKAIQKVFQSAGAGAELLEADSYFVQKVKAANVDLVFNIAEGTQGRGREAQVPAILNFLGIPFSGSDETTLAISLDKALAKRYLSTFRIKTPAYQYLKTPNFHRDEALRFPLIVKPDSEGSGKGITDLAVVYDESQLNCVLSKNFSLYEEPMLLEEYIPGREFTVGILGNGASTTVFEPMEICYLHADGKERIYSYKAKVNYKQYVTYRCPPDLDTQLNERMKQTARDIYDALECRDFSRIDFRLSDDGTLYFIEINPLPGLAPGYSDYPMLAEYCGMDYRTLILSVLNCALTRYGMEPLALNRGDLQ